MQQAKNIVIIPAYKPKETLIELVEKIEEKDMLVIVVDDGSGQEYERIFKRLPLVLTHESNKGKGCAIKTALTYIKEQFFQESNQGVRSIATMDCDGQHLVSDAIHILEESQKNPGKLILGVRDFHGNIPWKSKLGNNLTKCLFRCFYHVALQDTQTGLRAFSIDMVDPLLEIAGERYEYEMHVLTYCIKNQIVILERTIQTIYHDKQNSGTHFRAFKDSVMVYQDMIKFTLSSLSSFAVDYVLFGLFLIILVKVPEYVLVSNVLARIISACYNYLVNAKLVFKVEKPTVRSAMQYFLLAKFILCMNNLILSAVLYVTRFPAMLAKMITELLLFILSFLVQHIFIFKKIK